MRLSANFPFISSLIISVWDCGRKKCECMNVCEYVGVCVCETERGAIEELRATSLRDFIREEVHDVVMMCESWRRRRMMKSLPGNHIPTFRGAKVLNQSPVLWMLQYECVCEKECVSIGSLTPTHTKMPQK